VYFGTGSKPFAFSCSDQNSTLPDGVSNSSCSAFLDGGGLPVAEDHAFGLQLRPVVAGLLDARLEVFLDVVEGHGRADAELVGQLLGDPPAGLLVVRRLDHRLAQRDPAAPAPADHQFVVALEEHALRQHHVGVAGDLARHRVDHDHQVEASIALIVSARLGSAWMMFDE
jgi:hypothetical protein